MHCVVAITANTYSSSCPPIGHFTHALKESLAAKPPGPWTDKLLKQPKLKLQPIATFGAFWKCKSELYTPDKFPAFLKYGHPAAYALPMMNAHEGVKICLHDGPDVDPDECEGVVQLATEVARLQAYIAENFSNVDSNAPNQVDDCMYTMTPDSNFIIDFLEVPSSTGDSACGTKKIIVGAGFSGHGAKMTPVIGQILVDLALKGETNHPTELFRINRSR